ncbi:MAG: PD-(D/E)XK nuclease family protein [Betaproteobacteria bacterium]|nr:PD-(D/E)XK nuclease family protein [Betaproteobacteria bacterium]
MIPACEDDVLDMALQRIVRDALDAPDAPAVVLCPHAALADAFLTSLRELLPAPALPRVTTLANWAAGQPLDGCVVPDIERLALVFGALRERRWFEHQDHWILAREALGLVDEMTRWGFVMPHDPAAFTVRLNEAYAGRQSGLFQLEARFVHELWWVLHQDPHELSPAMAYQQQLASLAVQPHRGTCYLVAPGVLTPAEEACLAAIGTQARLVRFGQAEPGREGDPCTPLLRAAWREPVTQALETRAQNLREHHAESPLEGRLALLGVRSIEDEAALCAGQVQAWREHGRERVAVVAQDRVSARRLRALLERRGVPVRDESGWTFSTTAVSTVVMRWLEWVRTDGYYRPLQDLLHSPYLCADWPRERRDLAVAVLSAHLERGNRVSGLDALAASIRQKTDTDDPGWTAARELLERLLESARLFRRSAQPFAAWLEALWQGLQRCGIDTGLMDDTAGRQLLEILQQLTRDASATTGLFTLTEWVRALELQFETASFSEDSPAQAVCMTQLSMTRLRGFDAVWILGADADHLPFIPPPAYFGDAVRLALGLPTRETLLAACREDLTELVSRAQEVRVSWRCDIDGERNAPAPLLQRLDLLHQRAWGWSLMSEHSQPMAVPDSVSPPVRPMPVLAPQQVPQRISASGYNRLLACPYQYFAAAVLGLGEAEAIRETVDKRDYGELVHAILYRFHRAVPQVSALGREGAVARLLAETKAAFDDLHVPDGELMAWRLRWEARLGSYVDWMLAREAEGWRWSSGEQPGERLLGAHTPGQILLKGKLDRTDRRPVEGAGELAILDYKLKSYSARMVRDLRDGEDVQLAVYTLLAAVPVAQAAYLLLDEELPRLVASPDPDGIAAAVAARLTGLVADMRSGVPLPAHGQPDDCDRCEFGGLCRRAHWEEGA